MEEGDSDMAVNEVKLNYDLISEVYQKLGAIVSTLHDTALQVKIIQGVLHGDDWLTNAFQDDTMQAMDSVVETQRALRLKLEKYRQLINEASQELYQMDLVKGKQRSNIAIKDLSLIGWSVISSIVGVAIGKTNKSTDIIETGTEISEDPETIISDDNDFISATEQQEKMKKIVAAAENHLGENYVSGGDGGKRGGYDCIGLVRAAYSEIGVELPRSYGGKTWAEQGLVTDVTGVEGAPAPGDILCWNITNRVGQPDHVAIYTGPIQTEVINGTYKGYPTDSEGFILDGFGGKKRIDCINALTSKYNKDGKGICYMVVDTYSLGPYTDVWRVNPD